MPSLGIRELGRQLRAGSITATALAETALAAAAKLDPTLHAFIKVTSEQALRDARQADALFSAGRDVGPMQGIPYGLKDIIDAEGVPTTCQSRVTDGQPAVADSFLAGRLREQGAVLVGKLTTFEFAVGGALPDQAFPLARNPWNTALQTGGSSSGSAVAVAAGMLPMAVGTDTGGSIRLPAAYCGVVGVKPTYGRVSRRGVAPLAWSLDHCGPMAASVEDAAIGLAAMEGHDPADPASADVPAGNYLAGLEAGVAGLRIGLMVDMLDQGPVAAEVARVAGLLASAGAEVSDARLVDQARLAAAGWVIHMAEPFAIHAGRLRTRYADYGVSAADRMTLGATLTAHDYLAATQLRRVAAGRVAALFEHYDCLLCPTVLNTAPGFTTGPLPMAPFAPARTILFNLTGHPAVSVPTALDAAGLPMAVQLVGRHFDEATMLRAARSVEQLTGWAATRAAHDLPRQADSTFNPATG